MKTVLRRSELLHSISNLAYVIADVSEDKESPHTLHQTFDICEEGNLERVDSLLRLAAAEISAVSRHVRMTVRKSGYQLTFNTLPCKDGDLRCKDTNLLCKDTNLLCKDTNLLCKDTDLSATGGKFTEAMVRKFTELAREYMIACVLYGWLSITLPSAALHWSARKTEIMLSLSGVANGMATAAFTRRVPPI